MPNQADERSEAAGANDVTVAASDLTMTASGAGTATGDATTERQDTRRRLVETAIQGFASKGIHGLSLRAVAVEGGAKNTAAVHYHFTDREGLLAAALDRITQAMREDVSLDDAASLGLVLEPDTDAQRIVAETFAATLTLPLRYPDWGTEGVALLSRIITGDANGLGRRFDEATVADGEEVLDRLAPVLPDVPRDQLRRRLDFAVVSIVCGMAARTEEDDRRGTPSSQANALLDYVTAGLAAPVRAAHDRPSE